MEAQTWLEWRPSWRTEMIGRLCSGRSGCFLDVGANVGQTLADWSVACPDVPYLGFEPIPRCFAFLTDLVAANPRFREAHAHVLQMALGEDAGVAPLFLHDGQETDDQATLLRSLRPDRKLHPVWVPLSTLDAVWVAMGDAPVAAIKIDVEGAETDVIAGAHGVLERHRPPVICEVLRRHGQADEAAYRHRVERLWAILYDLGYRVHKVIKPKGKVVAFSELTTGFTLDPYGEDSGEDCDYLFSPPDRDFTWPPGPGSGR